jgi:hypothetical protein
MESRGACPALSRHRLSYQLTPDLSAQSAFPDDVSDAGLSFDVGAGGVELEESLLGAGVAAAWATLVLVEEAFPSVSSFVSESSFISSASLGLWHGSQ